tara:strand:+ start:1108 stop:1338 length:231 start_codon:yes stop_codon:yes gene_type:complete
MPAKKKKLEMEARSKEFIWNTDGKEMSDKVKANQIDKMKWHKQNAKKKNVKKDDYTSGLLKNEDSNSNRPNRKKTD